MHANQKRNSEKCFCLFDLFLKWQMKKVISDYISLSIFFFPHYTLVVDNSCGQLKKTLQFFFICLNKNCSM